MVPYEVIEELDIFRNFSRREKKAFAKMAHMMLEFRKGDLLLRQNERSGDLFLLLQGTCLVTRTEGDKSVRLAKLEAGELFGEMSVVSDLPRTSNVEARSDVLVLKMDSAFFDKVHQKMANKIHQYIIALLCRRLDQMNAAAVRSHPSKIRKKSIA
jgi:CRP-like cAMP-binding protein